MCLAVFYNACNPTFKTNFLMHLNLLFHNAFFHPTVYAELHLIIRTI